MLTLIAERGVYLPHHCINKEFRSVKCCQYRCFDTLYDIVKGKKERLNYELQQIEIIGSERGSHRNGNENPSSCICRTTASTRNLGV